MKKTILILTIALVAGLSFYTIEAFAGMRGRGYEPVHGVTGWGGYGGWGCPRGGQQMGWQGHGMGSGMMGRGMWGHGYGRGPGMMGRGYGQGPEYGPQYPQYPQSQRPMEEKDARAILEDYLSSMRNPNLKLGEIKDQGNAFEAEILTKENSLVDRVMVDKNTGSMRSVY